MTSEATEKGRRSDALYYDNVTRRNLCDRIANLESDLTESKAENAKLRELVDAPKCETCEAMLDCDECLRADGSHKERRRLSAENAKLRELVAEIYEDQCDNSERWRYRDRMRELGIELNDYE